MPLTEGIAPINQIPLKLELLMLVIETYPFYNLSVTPVLVTLLSVMLIVCHHQHQFVVSVSELGRRMAKGRREGRRLLSSDG